MGELAQLDWLKQYFLLGNAATKIKTPEDIYAQAFTPKSVGKGLSETLYKKGTLACSENASMNKNDNGIQKEELISRYFTFLKDGGTV